MMEHMPSFVGYKLQTIKIQKHPCLLTLLVCVQSSGEPCHETLSYHLAASCPRKVSYPEKQMYMHEIFIKVGTTLSESKKMYKGKKIIHIPVLLVEL